MAAAKDGKSRTSFRPASVRPPLDSRMIFQQFPTRPAPAPLRHRGLLPTLLLLLALPAPSWSASLPFPVSDSQELNIAYFIQISDATVTLLPRLLRTLWHPHNLYIVHFDKKIPLWQREHAQLSLFHHGDHYRHNVHVLPSEPVTYRGISMVLNNLNAMQAAIDHAVNWTFFINISGSDYPLVSPVNQRRLLAQHDFAKRNRSFFSFSERAWWNRSKSFRYDRLFTDTSLAFNDSDARVVDSFAKQPLALIHDFTFVAAEAWMILHRSFVTYLLQSGDARRLLLAFAYSLEPEEHFFPTAVYNAEQFNATAVPHALRHVVWTHNGRHSGQHPYYVDDVNQTKGTWTFTKSITNSGCFFTRKVQHVDSDLLQWIDEHVSGVAKENVGTQEVERFLRRVSKVVACLAELRSGDRAVRCLPDWTN